MGYDDKDSAERERRAIKREHRAERREAAAQAREAEREAREREEAAARAEASAEVAEHEGYLSRLQTLHHGALTAVDWRTECETSPPDAPVRRDVYTARAEAAWSAYTPSLVDRLLGRAKKQERALFDATLEAQHADQAVYAERLEDHERRLDLWREARHCAERVLAGDAEAWREVIAEKNPGGTILYVADDLAFTRAPNGVMVVDFTSRGLDIIPHHTKKLGPDRLTFAEPFTRPRRHALYLDAVCSATLRVASDVFAVLPAEHVVVTVTDRLLDAATGHLEAHPILSVAIGREALGALYLPRVDPSESLRNFRHRIAFDPAHGLAPITPLTPTDVAA